MRKEEETLDIEPPQVFIYLCDENVNECTTHTLTLNWNSQNADEIDKKLKSQEESLRKISQGSSIGEEVILISIILIIFIIIVIIFII